MIWVRAVARDQLEDLAAQRAPVLGSLPEDEPDKRVLFLSVVSARIEQAGECFICHDSFHNTAKLCQQKSRHHFVDCYQETLQKVITPDCLTYTETIGDGCQELLCQQMDIAKPGVCPGRGIPLEQDDMGPCGSPKDGHLGDEEWIKCLNEHSSFKAAPMPGMYSHDFKKMMGVKIHNQIKLPPKLAEYGFEAPDSFDVRNNWPECRSVSGHIRDQANCGSCWAHGTTEAFTTAFDSINAAVGAASNTGAASNAA